MKYIYLLAAALLIPLMSEHLISGDVLQHHRNSRRTGMYVDRRITRTTAAMIHRDKTFSALLPGPTYAQPLYIEDGPNEKAAIIVVTEQNDVLALSASDGSRIWESNLGNPVPLSQLPCGDIDPLGITGTPVIDPDARSVFVAALTTPDRGNTKQHKIFALSLDSGTVLPGWPVDVSGITSGSFTFDSSVQQQRGALVLSSGMLYVPYGGLAGDCGDYHGWVAAVPTDHPDKVTAWVTPARGGGIWAPGGLASDEDDVFAATGNTMGAATWMGGEAIIRLGPGATFSGDPKDFFTPSNWQQLDAGDVDLGGSGPVLINVPGARPSHLVLALGKNGVAYLLNRDNLGGIGKGDGSSGEGVQSEPVSTGVIINAAAAYRAPSGAYAVFNTGGTGIGCPSTPGNLVAIKIGETSPPTIRVAWCADSHGAGSPIVTTTNGRSEPVVWVVGAESSNRLEGLDGETGKVIFAGGGPDEQMSLVRRFQTPIAAKGRIFVASDDELFAFIVTPSPRRETAKTRRHAEIR